ncbi:MAG: YHS domain-containing (seleno)protein [Cyanobacteria bacterium P01_H01_bin.21]
MRINYLTKLAVALIGLGVAAGCAPSSNLESSAAPQPESIEVAEPEPSPDAAPIADAPAAVETIAAETVAVEPEETIQYFTDGAGLAIRGTDPVAYFTEGGPVAGSSEFTYTWNNATWQFASAENRDLFAANPEQYAPQYGGYCAWAVSQGYTAAIDPNAWKIVDGKLYLNFNKGVQRRWERDIPGNITRANANWPEVLTES